MPVSQDRWDSKLTPEELENIKELGKIVLGQSGDTSDEDEDVDEEEDVDDEEEGIVKFTSCCVSAILSYGPVLVQLRTLQNLKQQILIHIVHILMKFMFNN